MSRVIFESEKRITDPYGRRSNGSMHNGVDLGWRTNEEYNKVYANCKGVVAEVVKNQPHSPGSGSWGNYVLIKHPNGMYSRYCHLQNNIRVSVGQTVDENTWIGTEGSSGDAEFRHLHFEVQTGYSSSTRINPTPYLTQPISGSTPSGSNVDVTYRVKTKAHGWLPEVINAGDYAGWQDSPITGVAIKVNKGSIRYRVHIQGKGWLGWVTGYNINDINNGYAGNGSEVIDAIQIYYNTPSDIRPYKKAKYKVNGYSWQYDTETTGGQDGYAGSFGYSLKKLWITIE